MRTTKLLSVFVIVAVSVACTLAPGNDDSAGDLEIAVGEFDETGMAAVTVTVTTPSSGEGQLFLSVVPGGATLAQREWHLDFEAGVPQTIITSIQLDENIPAGGAFKLAGDFSDPKYFVHSDVVNIYIWPDGARVLQPGEEIPTSVPLEVRRVTLTPSP